MSVLKAGAGTGTITFPDSMFPGEGFKGIHDDPHFRVLVLDCGERVAIVSGELVNIPDEAIVMAKKVVSEKTGTKEENVWIHATHAITTPHAPHARPGEELSEADSAKFDLFMNTLEKAVTEAAEKAAYSFTDAVLGVQEGQCYVNSNRDIETPEGMWVGISPDGISNKTATVVKVCTPDGKPVGILINYDLKPCAIDNSEMESGNRLVSSDLPGYACSVLEEKYGCPVLFTMAAAGDQVPKEQAWHDAVGDDGSIITIDHGVEAGFEIVSRLGEEMADEISEIIDSASCTETSPEIRTSSAGITWPTKGRMKMSPRREAEFTPVGETEISAEIIAVGDTAFVAVKPETNTVTALQLKKDSPFSNTLLIAMVNGGMKYMPDKASYDKITWEAQSSMLMPGAAEAWVENVVSELEKIR